MLIRLFALMTKPTTLFSAPHRNMIPERYLSLDAKKKRAETLKWPFPHAGYYYFFRLAIWRQRSSQSMWVFAKRHRRSHVEKSVPRFFPDVFLFSFLHQSRPSAHSRLVFDWWCGRNVKASYRSVPRHALRMLLTLRKLSREVAALCDNRAMGTRRRRRRCTRRRRGLMCW
jgi:hypothetical protein